jgi:hypothetical protein
MAGGALETGEPSVPEGEVAGRDRELRQGRTGNATAETGFFCFFRHILAGF